MAVSRADLEAALIEAGFTHRGCGLYVADVRFCQLDTAQNVTADQAIWGDASQNEPGVMVTYDEAMEYLNSRCPGVTVGGVLAEAESRSARNTWPGQR